MDLPNLIFNFGGSVAEPSRRKRWLSYGAVLGLMTASTAVMMLCPCDVVSIHDRPAILLVAVASALAFVAVIVLYWGMSRASAITGFLRAVIAVAVVGLGVFVELFLAQEIVAVLARQ